MKQGTNEDYEGVLKSAFEYDLVMVKNLVNKLPFDKDFFTIKYLEENYPEMDVDVVEQKPNFHGFSFNW